MINSIKKQYKFLLEEFHFIIKNEYFDNDFVKIKFANNSTEINISFESRDAIVRVELIRLSDGQKYDFEDLIELRAPEKKFKQFLSPSLFSIKEFEKVLNNYANLMKDIAEDVILGDFNVFSELKKEVVKRSKY